MSSNAAPVLVRLGLVIACSILGFLALQQPMRSLETRASAALVRLSGTDRLFLVSDTSVLVLPAGRDPFRAIVTPSCSAVASVLGMVCLAFASGRRATPPTRAVALAVAVGAIALGNILRIAASLGVGLFAGRPALVLFHDWVGSTFAFAYTLGGYILMLYLILPRRTTVDPVHVRLT